MNEDYDFDDFDIDDESSPGSEYFDSDSEILDSDESEDVDEMQSSAGMSVTPAEAAEFYDPICSKLDIIIMLLIVFFAVYMFRGFANSYKLGGKHNGKSC